MKVLLTLVALCSLLLLSTAEDEWAYEWYIGEQFAFECDKRLPPKGNTTTNITETIIWDTPMDTKKDLAQGYSDDDFEVQEMGGVAGSRLVVKRVDSHVSGVYWCKIYSDGDLSTRLIYGLNIHSHKYKDLMDKYRRSIIVAFIATAVFLVPFLTICLVWHFRYLTEEQKAKIAQRKKETKHFHIYGISEHEMKKTPSDDGPVVSAENGAYDNPMMSTNM